jgi:hypothetical protein
MKQKLKYFILISFAVFLEYFRDYLFININLQINFLENLSNELSTLNYTDSNLLYLIKSLDTGTLNILKWGLSFLFAFLYFGIGFLFSKWFFSHKNHLFFIKLFSLGGLIVMFLSFLIYVVGKSLTLENQMNFYNVSIELSHFVQSSLYPISFLLVFFANNRTKISA